MWTSGSTDHIENYGYVFHDSKIFYHFMIFRGLLETFDILPDQDATYKENLISTLKLGINHVINYRLYSSSPSSYHLKYAFKTVDGIDIPWSEYSDPDIDKYIETLAKLAYYAKSSPYFNNTERENLYKLFNKISRGIDSNNKWHMGAMGYYMFYNNAINTNINVFNWNPDINYNPSLITDRTVSGDFDNDGKEDDIAAFYDYGSEQNKIHVWKSQGNHFEYQNGNGWWSALGYDANKITGRIVSGDFDRDGYNDDIAAFYDYGNENTRIHVWTSNGSSFDYKGEFGWWNVSGYTSNQITDRVISGDFDRDGYKDDIAAFYDYGFEQTKIHVWTSTGSSFTYYGNGWCNDIHTGYNSNKITGRIVNGDFDRDGYKDDIAAFYDYGFEQTKIHVWTSTGSAFTYYGNGWCNAINTGYNANMITGRVINGDFDRDGYRDDIAAYYDYGNEQTKIHVWTSTGSGLSYYGNGWCTAIHAGYNSNMITNRIVPGDFDNDGYFDDLTCFYEYGTENTRMHIFKGNTSSFYYPNASSWWLDCWPVSTRNFNFDDSMDEKEYSETIDLFDKNKFQLYPNPNNGSFKLTGLNTEKSYTIDIYNVLGYCISRKSEIKEGQMIEINDKTDKIVFISLYENGIQIKTFKMLLN